MTTSRQNQRTNRTTPKTSIPAETKMLNTSDGEPGSILNGFTWDTATGEWTEYEVVTQYGIERWQRRDFVLMSEIETNDWSRPRQGASVVYGAVRSKGPASPNTAIGAHAMSKKSKQVAAVANRPQGTRRGPTWANGREPVVPTVRAS